MLGVSVSVLHVWTKLGKKFTRKSCRFRSTWNRSNNSLQNLLLWFFTFIHVSLFVQLAIESVNLTCSPRQSFHNNHLLSFTLLLILTTLFTGHKLFDITFFERSRWASVNDDVLIQKIPLQASNFLTKIQVCLLFHKSIYKLSLRKQGSLSMKTVFFCETRSNTAKQEPIPSLSCLFFHIQFKQQSHYVT